MSEPCRLRQGEGYGARDDESRTPPRRAHDTLQMQDESIIVGYYTSAEVHPQKLPTSQPPLWGEKGVLWQEATVSIVPAQEI